MFAPKIVVVEDERIVGLNLQQRLIRMGYDVPELAVSASEAIARVNQCHPDLILMDINIEGELDGIEATKLIKEQHDTPVVYLTAYSEENTLARAKITKPHGYLLKPFSERELHATIQMALERYKIEQALNQSEERLRMALSAAEMTDWELTKRSDEGEVLYAAQADTILGYSERVFCGNREDFMQLVAIEDRNRVNNVIENSLKDNLPCDVEYRTAQPVASQRWLRLQGKVVEAKFSKLLIVGIIQNISERKITEQRLQEAATVFNVTQDGILILDLHGHIISSNESFATLTGFQPDPSDHIKKFIETNSMRARVSAELDLVLSKGGAWRHEIRINRNDLDPMQALMSVNSVESGDTPEHFVVVITDLTAVRSMEKQLEFMAHHDPLTGLPNRLLTKERLIQSILRSNRNREKMAVVFLDIDYFKWINDSLGHDTGDYVLKTFSARISSHLRASDTIGRLGGDEFLVILDPVHNEETTSIVIEKLMKQIMLPITVEGHTIDITCSIGISLFPADGVDSDTLIRTADSAMYEAKRNGRQRYEFYTPSMMEKADRFLKLNHDLRRGIKSGELCLYYQPQVAIDQNNLISGVESLLRWQHPEKGLITPADIIPIAEDGNTILEIGNWVLLEACTQMSLWLEANKAPETISVNVSPLQLRNKHFARIVKDTLTKTGCPPERLELEVTESMLQNSPEAIKTLHEIKRSGVKIAIDDFGTGYSNLSSLKQLPITKLKIDRSFITDIPEDTDDAAIVELIINFAHKLDLTVTAEGVETKEQYEFLKNRSCHQIQGYYFYKPMTHSKFTSLLDKSMQV